jgi:creatinine amidohydrolase/Fe(II)-dependent formamide hydrolase-like protein
MTPTRAQFLRAFCNEFGAFAPESFWLAFETELAAACNGIGPDCWPAWLRHTLTWLLRPLEASAAIHDWEYSLPDKTFRSFTAANAHLAANVMLEAVYDCRPACMLTGIPAALLCQIFGWRAYKNGRPRP